MPVITVSRGRLAGLGLLAVITSAGCAAHPAPSPPASSQAASSAAITPGSSPATSAAPAPSASADAIENLAADGSVRSELISAYEAYVHIPPADVTGLARGSLYYAYDPAASTYWALASFVPSAAAPQNVLVGFQDGGATGLFTKAGRGTWQVRQGGVPGICAELKFFPPAVLTAWSLPTAPPPGVGC
jgi:hypothetical protein